MQIVYLDQNAACSLAQSDPGTLWPEIRKALTDGFRTRKLICPLPVEGILETAPMALERRQSIQDLFWDLSEGIGFEEFTEISKALTLALIRPAPGWSPWILWKPIWAEMAAAAESTKAIWETGKQVMMERLKGFVRSPKEDKMSLRELFHATAAQRSGWIYRDLDHLLAGQTSRDSVNCPWLVEFLISANVSPAEIEALKRAVQYHGWAKIPIHMFEILLGSKWEYDLIRRGAAAYHPNDEIDRKRAAIALSHADIFITEGDMANPCQRAKVNEFSPTLVLSVRNPREILKTVRAIIAN